MNLRPYQSDALHALRMSLARGHRRPILPAPTGAGKTVVAAELVRLAREKGKRVLFIAPRRELIRQASEKFANVGVHHGIILAGHPRTITPDVQIASFDTLHVRGIRNKTMLMPPADLVIVDECHLATSPTRRAILDHYRDAVVIGLSATPATGSGKGLGAVFDDIVPCVTISDLTDQGYLVPVRYFAPTEPDLAAVKIARTGDYDESSLAAVMDRPKLVGDIVGNWRRLAPGASTAVFCVTREHARHVCAEFVAAGVSSEYLDGETPHDERDAILKRVASGRTTVLVNVFVASYGLDIPSLQCAVLARPTRSLVLYLQIVGRVLRPADGKDHAIVIDHAGAVKAHGMVDEIQPWSLDASDTVSERKTKLKQEKKEPKDITCAKCKTVFKARHDCPSCGFCVIPHGKALPVHEADLVEIGKAEAKANRAVSMDEKIVFIGSLKSYATEKGFSPGWVAHKYREKFGVWPNDPRLKDAPAVSIDESTRRWLLSQQIRFAKSKERRAA